MKKRNNISVILIAFFLFVGVVSPAFALTLKTTLPGSNKQIPYQAQIVPSNKIIRPLDKASLYTTFGKTTTTTKKSNTVSALSGVNTGVVGGIEGISPFDEPLYQQDKYTVNLFTGTTTYSYPFTLPKGTNDLTPTLALSYSHQAAHDPSMFAGSGWELDTPYIATNTNSSPLTPSGFTYQLHFNGQTQDIVFSSVDNKYHAKIESFLSIQKMSSGGQNNDGVYWIVTTKNGTVYRFGYQTQSELACNGQSYQYKWVLDQVTDLHGNNMYYSYTQSNGQIYLAKITYNNDNTREVDINYTANPYQKQYYVQGCSLLETNLLSSILVKDSGKLIHEYDMSMSQAVTGQNILSSITEKGTDGSALPPTKFSYNPDAQSFNGTSTNYAQADLGTVLSNTNTQFCQMTGSGLPDIVQSPGAGGGTWNVHINRGDHFDTGWTSWGNLPVSLSDPKVRLVNVDGSGRCDIVQTTNINNTVTYMVWLNNGSQFSGPVTWMSINNNNNQNPLNDLSSPDTTLLDINGDGLPDVVHMGSLGWEVLFNTGSSWSSNWVQWAQNVPNFSWANVRVFSTTGDGLPDVVQSNDNGNCYVTWQVWKNTGSGFAATPETWVNNSQICVRNDRADTTIADVYGNGLPDLIEEVNLGTSWGIQVYKNTGNGWSTTPVLWLSGNLAQDFANTKFVDLHGTGLVDVVYTPQQWQWYDFANQGYAPDTLASTTSPQQGTTSYQYTPSTTVNNNGNLPFPLWLVSKKTVDNGLTNGQHTQDVTSYSYAGGSYAYQQREFRGFKQVNQTNPDGSVEQDIFNQDDALKGTLSTKSIIDSLGKTYDFLTNTYSSTQSNGIFTNLLTTAKDMIYEGQTGTPLTKQTDYAYDQYGNVTQAKDYDFSGNVLRTTNTSYVYNPSLWLVNLASDIAIASSGATAQETFNYYDGSLSLTATPTKGDVTQQVKWLNGGTNPTTTATYDNFGNQISITDANGNKTQTTYDVTGTYPTQVTNAKNQITNYSYDLGTGNLLSKTDPNNSVTSFTYDPFGRVLTEVDPGDSSTLPTDQYTYFDTSFPTGSKKSQRITVGGTNTYDTYTFLDGLGRTIQTRKPSQDTTKQLVIDTYFASNGKVAQQTVPHSDAAASTYVTPVSGIEATQYTYDPLLRMTKQTNPSGTTKTYAYSHITTPTPLQVVTTTDENGNSTKKLLDASQNITEVDQTIGATLYPTLYSYDTLNNLTQIKDSQNHITTFTYDSLGRKITTKDPDMGLWSYTYDGNGNLLTRTDTKGVTTTKTYDALNRVTQVKFPNDIPLSYIYDIGTIGTLSTKLDSAGEEDYYYDNRQRKTQTKRTIDTNVFTTQYAYDDMDHLMSQTNPDNETITSTYNPQGELLSLTGATPIIKNIDYNAFGQMTDKQLGNGATTNYTYNITDFRLNKIQTGTAQNISYSYDNVGNVLAATDATNNTTQTYGYDSLYRLTSASQTNGYNHTFAYDDIGNMTKFINNGVETDYTYGQSAGVHALTTSTENLPTPTPTPTGISLRAATSGNNGTAHPSLVINVPAGTTTGDVMVAHITAHPAGNIITPPSGWTLIARQDSAVDISTATYWKLASASEPASYTWNFGTAGEAAGGIASYIGVNTTNPVDAFSVKYNSGTSSVTTPGVTTTGPNDMLVYAVGITANTTVNVAPGFHQEWTVTSSTNTTSEMADEIDVNTGATGTITESHNAGAVSNITQLIALRPASATPTPTPQIQISNKYNNHALSGSTLTISNVAIASGQQLIVSANGSDGTGNGITGEVTGVTFGGAPLTKIVEDTSGLADDGIYTSVWQLSSPTPSTANVVITYNGTPSHGTDGTAYVVSNAQAVISATAHNGNGGTASSPQTNTITTTADGSLILDSFMAASSGESIVVGSSPQVQDFNVQDSGGSPFGQSHVSQTTHGVQGMSWSPSNTGRGYTWSAIALAPTTSVTPTPNPTPTPTPTPTPAGISLRAATSGNNGTAHPSLVINTPAGTTTGDIMVAHITAHPAGNTITPPSGWNLIARQDSAVDISTATYWKLASASEPASYTWNFGTSGDAAGGIASYIGVNTTSPVDAFVAQYNSGTGSVTTPGVTTTGPNDMLVYAVGITANTTVNVAPGFHQEWTVTSSTNTTSEMADEIDVNTGATGTIAESHNAGSISNITQLIALRPAGTTPIPQPQISNKYTNHALSGSTLTVSNVTIASGQQLIVSANGSDGTANATSGEVTGVTFGGTPLTKVVEDTSGLADDGIYTSFWQLASPTATTANVIVTYKGTPAHGIEATAYAISNAQGTIAATAHNGNGSTASSPQTNTITTTVDNGLILDSFMAASSGETISVGGAPQVQDANVQDAGGSPFGQSHVLQNVHGAQTLSWSPTNTGRGYTWSAIALYH